MSDYVQLADAGIIELFGAVLQGRHVYVIHPRTVSLLEEKDFHILAVAPGPGPTAPWTIEVVKGAEERVGRIIRGETPARRLGPTVGPGEGAR